MTPTNIAPTVRLTSKGSETSVIQPPSEPPPPPQSRPVPFNSSAPGLMPSLAKVDDGRRLNPSASNESIASVDDSNEPNFMTFQSIPVPVISKGF